MENNLSGSHFHAAFSCETPRHSPHHLDVIMNKLSTDNYRSVFFLLMDFIGPREFLFIVKQDRNFLKTKFYNTYYEFHLEVLLIEILGTMQKYELLKTQRTCQHVFLNDKETYNRINSVWKCLYSVCEQLTDGEVIYLKEKLFSDSSICNVTCAEELFCHALLKNIFQENDLSNLAGIFKDFNRDCYNLISSFKGASMFSYYPIRRPTKSSSCGIAVILNHVNFHSGNNEVPLSTRPESHLDAEALKKLWEGFGFKTLIYNDLTDEQVLELFHSISKENHSSYDAFIACYLSHGDEGIVYASNCKTIKLVDLMEIIANRCPTLYNKPKLFFVQACQGLQIQQGVGKSTHSLPPVHAVEEQLSKFPNTPLYSDILIVNSTFPGFVSFRPTGRNTWFIDALVSAMEKYGEELTISNVMTKVTNSVAQRRDGVPDTAYRHCKQIPIYSSTLKYELKLKKLFENITLTNL